MALFDNYIDQLSHMEPLRIRGRVDSVRGLTLRVSDLAATVDASVEIVGERGERVGGQVVGFENGLAVVMPLGPLGGIGRGDRVEVRNLAQRIVCSPMLVGRVIDALGNPLDGKGPIKLPEPRAVNVRSVDAMRRVPIDRPITTGIRAVDGLLTCGVGQRMGIFAGPGVGKSTLMSMISRNTSAQISVIALIGERGREVQDFLQHSLGEEGLRRAIVVVSTADDPPILRVRAARAASTIAEYFRDAGLNVLLLLDSLTRMAQAQRQIGLSVGEPPATKGYTPSVFALLPEILERAGKTERGSITGFYTVLVEGDDFNEPIADAVKGITDGHLWLDRHLANKGHFPAVGVLQSISRVRPDVTDADMQAMVRRVTGLIAAYEEIEDLVNIGAYSPGASAANDLAVRTHPKIVDYLQQPSRGADGGGSSLEQTRLALTTLVQWIDKEAKAIEQQNRSGPAKKK